MGPEPEGYADQPNHIPIQEGLKYLEDADLRVGHNSQDFDERVTRKLFPWWSPKGRCLDTLIIARLLYARVLKTGPNNWKLPPQLRFGHSLKAWGMRLGENKADYDGGWEEWNPEMHAYMLQDVKTLRRLFAYLMSKKPSPEAVTIEHAFAEIIRRQEAWGFTFDMEAATKLAAELATTKAKLEQALIETFDPWWHQGKMRYVGTTRRVKQSQFPNITRKRFSKATGKELTPYVGPPEALYEEGSEYQDIEWTIFNPASRDHVLLVLKKKHGWKPSKKTVKGEWAVDDEVLRGLPWPEAQHLADYYQVSKLLGYVTGGKKAWLKTMRQEDNNEYRQHGRVLTIGTYTHRPTLSDPNMGQIPAVSKGSDGEPILGLPGGYGWECRSLFTARRGFTLVGADASGVQLRMYASRLAKYDGGAYAKIVAEEDPHAWLRDLIGSDIMGEGAIGRAHGKTLNYAILLGAGNQMAGSIPQPTWSPTKQMALGKEMKARRAERFPVATELEQEIRAQVDQFGYIVGLDSRKVDVLKAHTGLATMLQCDETVALKKALAIHDKRLQSEGARCGVNPDGSIRRIADVDYEFVVNVYDEFQADVRDEWVERYKASALWAIPEAGRLLDVKCPLKGEVKVGRNWAETH